MFVIGLVFGTWWQVRVQNDFLIAGIDLCSEGFVLLRNNPKTSSKEVVYVNNGYVSNNKPSVL
jgi:hypothetical protein